MEILALLPAYNEAAHLEKVLPLKRIDEHAGPGRNEILAGNTIAEIHLTGQTDRKAVPESARETEIRNLALRIAVRKETADRDEMFGVQVIVQEISLCRIRDRRNPVPSKMDFGKDGKMAADGKGAFQ